MRGTAIGSYTILDKLGEGGMGTVWVAEHTLLGRRAAIKLLHSTFSTNELIGQRFFDEAKAIAAIGDPGIVQIFDFGVHSDGSPYIVMELLDGEPLDARLRRLGRLSPGDAVRIAKQAALSLCAAHGKGVIHRDVKPENLFVVADPVAVGGERVKVLDFGIAKLSRGDGKYKTRTGAVIGTPAYMSPEQCRAIGNIDLRTDIYSLGAVLFCLVTGRPPFEGEGAGDAIISHVRDQPPVPSSLAPGLPVWLDSVILRCLEKEPGRRYQGMDELAAVLDGVEPGLRERAATTGAEARYARPVSQAPAGPVAAVTPGASSVITTISDAPGEVTLAHRAARRRWMGLAIGGGVALGVAAAIAFSGSGGTGEKAAPVAPAETPAAVAPAAPVPPVAPAAPVAEPDAAIPVDAAEPVTMPVEQPPPVQRRPDKPRIKEGPPRHEPDPKPRPAHPVRVDRND